MLRKIQSNIGKLLKEAGITGTIEFSQPPKSDMGDLAFGCFEIAKKLKKNPVDVAKETVIKIGKLKDSKIIDTVKSFGPYVNFYLNIPELARLALDKKNTVDNIGKGKKVLIEYPSQNTHKEFHIGHLRNVCIGNTLVQLYKESGFKIIPVNYPNDFGFHVVKFLWGIEHGSQIGIDSTQIEIIENKQKWLGDVYAKASGYIKDHDEEVRGELETMQKVFEAKEEPLHSLFLKTRTWSEEGFQKLFDELALQHEDIFYESDLKEKGQKLVDELLKKGIAQVGERGAIIIDLEKYQLGIALLRKSTGAGLYLTSDLALAREKFGRYDVGESINVTGSEQDHYFKQLFKVLELDGFTHKMTHIGYGLVNLPSGKMSSRAGNVILYEDLRDEIFALLKKETLGRHSDWGKEKIQQTAHILTMAVLKFTIQKHESNKVITFDMAEATSFEGFSAPYILYVVARINSLLRSKERKIKNGKNTAGALREPEEKQLLMQIISYPQMVAKALEQYNPSVVARYCFDLAKSFNNFYNKCPVLKAESSELVLARLKLCVAVRDTLVQALGLLTIETVEEM